MNPLLQFLQRLNIGWVLLGWLLVTVGIALNRGIDLLWGMAVLLACAIAASLLLPRLQLRGIAVRRLLPQEAVAGQPLSLEYEIEVRGGLPRYGLELLDSLGTTAELVPAAYLHRLSGRQRLRFLWTPEVRGVRRFGDVLIESRFPLGLSCARRRIALPEQQLVVYPAAVPLRSLLVEDGTEPQSKLVLSNRRGGHDEFFGLRPYRPGDPLRSVHWRASARLGELLSREYEHQHDRRLWIVLDLSARRHSGAGVRSTAESMFKIAHSLALKARSESLPVGLLYRDDAGLHRLEPALDQLSYMQLRDRLALVPVADFPDLDSWLAGESERLPKGGSWLLFNLAGASRRTQLAALCRRRQAQPLLIEFDHDSFRVGAGGPRTPPLRHRQDGVPIWIVAAASDLGALLS